MRLPALSAIAAASLFAVLAWVRMGLHPGALSLELASTPAIFGSVVHSWSPEQLSRYRDTLLLEPAFLIAYGVFGYALATRALAFQGLPRLLLLAARWLMPCAAFANLLQVALLWWLTDAPRFGMPAVYRLAFVCTVFKLCLVAVFALLIAFAHGRTES